jgi:hypothetical protein
MKNLVNSGKPETGEAVGNPEPSPENSGKVQRLSREGVGPSGPKREAPRTGEKIVRSLPKGKAVHVCNACGIPKIIPDDYYGSSRVCRECIKTRVAAYQKTAAGRESHRKAQRRWNAKASSQLLKADWKKSDKGIEAERRYYASKMDRIPEKLRARALVNTHVRRGKIRKPANCESCGKTCAVEAHHEDYTRPLDVQWLCRDCHERVGISDPN